MHCANSLRDRLEQILRTIKFDTVFGYFLEYAPSSNCGARSSERYESARPTRAKRTMGIISHSPAPCLANGFTHRSGMRLWDICNHSIHFHRVHSKLCSNLFPAEHLIARSARVVALYSLSRFDCTVPRPATSMHIYFRGGRFPKWNGWRANLTFTSINSALLIPIALYART